MNITTRSNLSFGLIILGAALTLIVCPIGQVLAQEAPPEKPGNPGVPGLLAEIAALEIELADTEDELADTEDELADTEDELADTEDELADTEDELADTEDELNAERQLFRVPRTGQDQCWDAQSNDPDDPHYPGPCASNGQDGDKQAGLAPPLDRFIDNDNGTITDKFTRLVWLKSGVCSGVATIDWKGAVRLAGVISGNATIPICDVVDDSHLGDWRLPNVNELMSLLDYGSMTTFGVGLPDGHPFVGYTGYYWTSTTFGLAPDYAVSNVVYPCRRQGYDDNRFRFNDAYVVDVTTGELVRLPKEAARNISKRHKIGGSVGSCVSGGFTSGSPDDGPYVFPTPRMIAVRDAKE